VSASGRNAQDRTVHCPCKQDRPIGAPSPLGRFWRAADHFGDSTGAPNLLQLAPRPESDELRIRRPERQKRIVTLVNPFRFRRTQRPDPQGTATRRVGGRKGQHFSIRRERYVFERVPVPMECYTLG